jgi:hypothetical protein
MLEVATESPTCGVEDGIPENEEFDSAASLN